MKLLFATTNAGKLAELEAMLAGEGDIVSLRALPPIPEPVEDGATFEANAEKKARYYAAKSGLAALADDSGLCVEALGGRPGVHSARYVPGTDEDRLRQVLADMKGKTDRRASFVCGLCLALPDGRVFHQRGEVHGELLDEPRGTNGFGYDPIFFVPSLGKTTAELTRDEKASISHRGRALRAMRPTLQSFFAGQL